MFQTFRERQKVLNAIFLDAQGWVFTIVFYFTIMIPFGIGTRLLGDPLKIKGNPQAQWTDRPPISDKIEEAKRQG